jgi:hypothetical protein
MRSWVGSVDIVTKLRAARWKNRNSTPDNGKRFFSANFQIYR